MAESYSPSTVAGSLMRKLFVSTTHCAEAIAQDASSRPNTKAGLATAAVIPLPLVEGAEEPSICWAPCTEHHIITVSDTGCMLLECVSFG